MSVTEFTPAQYLEDQYDQATTPRECIAHSTRHPIDSWCLGLIAGWLSRNSGAAGDVRAKDLVESLLDHPTYRAVYYERAEEMAYAREQFGHLERCRVEWRHTGCPDVYQGRGVLRISTSEPGLLMFEDKNGSQGVNARFVHSMWPAEEHATA